MENEILDDEFLRDENLTNLDRAKINEINKHKIELNTHIQNIRNARVALIVLIVLTFIGMAVSYNLATEYGISPQDILIEGLVLIVIYTISVLGLKYNPAIGLLIPLLIYIFYALLVIAISPDNIFRGLIVKIIITYYLAKGTISAFSLKSKLNRLYHLGMPDDEVQLVHNLKKVPSTRF